ncbi:MAG: four helix bundle protein [Bacteroidota bacterium]
MKFDLEERLIKFASSIIEIAESLPEKKSFHHLGGQLIRSGTAPALMYGEAQAAESKNDFVHKMKLALKELRETSINLRIISLRGGAQSLLPSVLRENIELISIFVKSIKTASSH